MKATTKNQASQILKDKDPRFPTVIKRLQRDPPMMYSRFMVRGDKACYSGWNEKTNKLVEFVVLEINTNGGFTRTTFDAITHYTSAYEKAMDVIY